MLAAHKETPREPQLAGGGGPAEAGRPENRQRQEEELPLWAPLTTRLRRG